MKKILIVEDEEFIQEVWEYQFKEEGYEVILASSGDEGVEKIKSHDIDIVLTDLKMPGSDGKVVLSYLKENQINIPAFVCSGFINDSELKELKEFSILKIIKKPFDIEKEFLEIERLINQE